MSETNTENNDTNKKEYTPEELKKMRENTIKFYKQENAVLRVEYEYYDLKAKIEEAKIRELDAVARYHAFMQPVQEEHQPERGDDGFPVEWTAEAKEQWKKEHPEETIKMKEHLAKIKEAKDLQEKVKAGEAKLRTEGKIKDVNKVVGEKEPVKKERELKKN